MGANKEENSSRYNLPKPYETAARIKNAIKRLVKTRSHSVDVSRERILGMTLLQSSMSKTEQSSLPAEVIEYVSALIKESGYFDERYYLANNKDVAKSGLDALFHFVSYGGAEGRNPSDKFDSKYYLSHNADVREVRINPLLHYILVGRDAGRRVKPFERKVTPRAQDPKASRSRKVDIINVNFYDWQGKVLYKGGAERYVFDLAQILAKMGHKPRILQNATVEFNKVYRGIEVVGVKTGAKDACGTSLRKMSKKFAEVCSDADLIIASPLDLACEIEHIPTIGINHGIHWDTNRKSLHTDSSSNYREIFDALSNLKLAVCVDTNFINWTRTYDYNLGRKLRYVPNYYDKAEFLPTEKDFTKRLKIMYPRRLYEARGIYFTLESFDYLLNKYDNIDLLLVGQTDDPDVKKAVKELVSKHEGRVTQEEYDMEDMHKAYQKSHIVLIPTMYAEGTSLSCLEAMATNNALISTNIGGLPNLVIDQYNGLLIDPSTEALTEAVETLANNRELTQELAVKGLDLVKVFEKSNWDKHWKKLLEEEL